MGINRRVCQANGQWSGEAPSCARKNTHLLKSVIKDRFIPLHMHLLQLWTVAPSLIQSTARSASVEPLSALGLPTPAMWGLYWWEAAGDSVRVMASGLVGLQFADVRVDYLCQ